MTDPSNAVLFSGQQRRRDQLAVGWASRVTAELITAVLAFVSGAIVAQRLGPAGKGEVSTLGYLVALVTTIGALGLGEAAATMHGRHGTPLKRSLSASTPVLAASSIIAVGITAAAAALQLSGARANTVSVVAACVPVPAMIFARALLAFLDAEHRIVASSMIRLCMTATTAAATWMLVLTLDRGVAGALAAPLLGSTLAALAAGALLLRIGADLRPRIDREDALRALRYGTPLMTSVVILGLANRSDIFLVRALTDNRETGLYSVALTVGLFASYPADSLLAVAYPRLARLPDDDVLPYVTRLTRAAVGASAITAAAGAALAPLLIPLIFGEAFRPSIGPSFVLLAGTALYGAQCMLSRSLAARGHPRLAVTSFTASLVAMLLLDLLLVPAFGMNGAAAASFVALACGLAVSIRSYRATYGDAFRMRHLLPRTRDVTEFRSLISGRGGGAQQ